MTLEIWKNDLLIHPMFFSLPVVQIGVFVGTVMLFLALRDRHYIGAHTANHGESEQILWAGCPFAFSCLSQQKRKGPEGCPCCHHPQSHCPMPQRHLEKDKGQLSTTFISRTPLQSSSLLTIWCKHVFSTTESQVKDQ